MTSNEEFRGSSFVGGDWQNGFGLRFTVSSDGPVTANYVFDDLKQGPPGLVHGGALAAVMDEAMTAAVMTAGYLAFTVKLKIDFMHAVRIGQAVIIAGQLHQVTGRKLSVSAQITLPDGTLATKAEALFITPESFHESP